MGLFFTCNAVLSETECRQVVWKAHVSDGHEGPTNADGSPEKGSAAYYATLVSSFSPQQERQGSGGEKAAIVNEETQHARQAASSFFLMAHECPSRSSRLPDADETTVCMVVGGWFAAGATHHFDAGVPNISISFVDCRPAPLGGLAPRSPLNETSGSSYG